MTHGHVLPLWKFHMCIVNCMLINHSLFPSGLWGRRSPHATKCMDESGGQIHTKRRRRCRRKSFKDAKNNSGPSGTRENGTLLPAYATGASARYISECSITMHHTGEEIQRECASLELGDWRALALSRSRGETWNCAQEKKTRRLWRQVENLQTTINDDGERCIIYQTLFMKWRWMKTLIYDAVHFIPTRLWKVIENYNKLRYTNKSLLMEAW
jgi:hypothetical protein